MAPEQGSFQEERFVRLVFHWPLLEEPKHTPCHLVALSQGSCKDLKFGVELTHMDPIKFLQKARKDSDGSRSHTSVYERGPGWRCGD